MKIFKKRELPKEGYSPPEAIFITVFIFFLAQIIGGLLIALYPLLKGYGENEVAQWSEGTIVQFILIFIVEAITIGLIWQFLKRRKRDFKYIGLIKPKFFDFTYAILGFAVYFVSFIAITVFIKLIVPSLDLDQQQQIGFETAKTNFELIFVFISLVLLPPIAEEILCRGLLFSGLREKYNFIMSAVITSILFACAHLQFGSDAPLLWVAAIDTFVLSMILSYLREKTGSLCSPIALHMIKNGLAFVVLFVI